MRRKFGFGALLLMLTICWGTSALADANVWVVHGVPNVTVDIYINYQPGDDPALEDFTPLQIIGPVELPAGNAQIDIYVAGADPEADAPAISGTAILVDDQNVSLVAHLTESGGLTLSQFGLDLRRTGFGKTRLGVRHAAAAPSVDVIAKNGYFRKQKATINVTNPGGASIDLIKGPYSIALALPGTTDPIFGPLQQNLRAGKIYYAYAVGEFFGGTFTILLQELEPEDDNFFDNWRDRWRGRDDD